VLDKGAFDIIGEYYKRSSADDGYVPGRICETRTYYLPPGPLKVLRFDYEAANQGEQLKYEVGEVDAQTFNHTPVRLPIPLQRDEALGVVTMKNRRVVLLSNPVRQPHGAPRQDFLPSYLVCPMFRFRDTHSTEFRLRVQAWEYEWLFHLPASDEFGIAEGFLRLDRLVAIPLGQLRLTNVMLSESALLALQECLNTFIGGTMDRDFADYRRLLLGELNRVLASETGDTPP